MTYEEIKKRNIVIPVIPTRYFVIPGMETGYLED